MRLLCLPPKSILIKWFAQAERGKVFYEEHKKVIGRLFGFYNEMGLHMMLLKGYGLSLNYPQPDLRPVGDIDIFLLDTDSSSDIHKDGPLYKWADNQISKRLGIKIDNSHHHHSVFIFENAMVENHFELISVADHPSSRRIENILQEEQRRTFQLLMLMVEKCCCLR